MRNAGPDAATLELRDDWDCDGEALSPPLGSAVAACGEADLGVCEAPAARTSNAGPVSAIMIDSSGDPISGRSVGCWCLMSIHARGCMLTTIHLRRDRRKEQQQQLASYMTEHDGDVVGFGDTRLGENAGIMDRLTKRAMIERREERQR